MRVHEVGDSDAGDAPREGGNEMTVLDTAKAPEVVPVEGAQRVTLFLKNLPVRIEPWIEAYNSRDVVQRRAVAIQQDETAVVCVDVPDGTSEADTAAALNEAESLLESADRLYAARNGAPTLLRIT
jgi:hypothetical protein